MPINIHEGGIDMDYNTASIELVPRNPKLFEHLKEAKYNPGECDICKTAVNFRIFVCDYDVCYSLDCYNKAIEQGTADYKAYVNSSYDKYQHSKHWWRRNNEMHNR